MSLEDNWLDIVEKARRGRGLDVVELCVKSGITIQQWQSLAAGDPTDEAALTKVARTLNIGAKALFSILNGNYEPDTVEIPYLKRISTTSQQPGYREVTANAYVVCVPKTNDAVLFDTGTEARSILIYLASQNLRVIRVFITHSHHDHTGGLDELHSAFPEALITARENAGLPAYVQHIKDGETVSIGKLKIEASHTSGHTIDSISYVVRGLSRTLVFCGDAMFAGSAGKADNWQQSLDTVFERILSLPQETIICAGHGPLTTVTYERAHNPLFAEAYPIASDSSLGRLVGKIFT